jgi:hypothetical protein
MKVPTPPYRLEHNAQKRRRNKQYRDDNREPIQEKLGSSARMVRSTEVISAECTSHARTTLLQKHSSCKENGEDYLGVRKYGTDDFHDGKIVPWGLEKGK